MNFSALYLAFCISSAVLLIFWGIYSYSKREISISRFVPNFSLEKQIKKTFSNEKRLLSYRKRLLIITIGGSSCGIAIYAVVGNMYVSALSSLLGLLFPSLWYKWYRKGQAKMVSLQMAKAAETMASIVRSDGNIIAALERASIDTEEPLKTKLNETAKKIRLGVKADIAFTDLAKNIDVPEMIPISIGIELQQKGMAINLANMLEQIHSNILTNQADREELQAITAENKMAGWIVSALPFGTLAIMRFILPDFIDPLFTSSIGIAIFLCCIAVILVGLYWLLQIAEMNNS